MTHYTDEKQAQIVIALLKAHGIRQVIASPGTTNMAFVGSIQTDPFFTIRSAVDERSAAYMACGLAAETGEPVVLSCTGATASRNYLPGLTEAFYRKLPVLALTSMQGRARAGHHVAQVIDRSTPPADAVKLSVDLPVVKDKEDVWECEMKVNRALLELTRHGGGPVHINLPTTYSRWFNEQELPGYRVINRITVDDALPPLTGRVGVFIGSHKTWTAEETSALDRFCEAHDAVVFCDHTSGYHGKYRVLSALIGGQEGIDRSQLTAETLIHIGEVSGDYEIGPLIGKDVWRVSPDGEIRDSFRKLRYIFEMSEKTFFNRYLDGRSGSDSFLTQHKKYLAELRARIPELPFSNLWLASKFAGRVPPGSVMHFAILNSLRAWNYFELPEGVRSSSNVGGFGIDGCMSSLIGASLADKDRLFFLVIGDLAFFYDMNVLGMRHLAPNVRILLVNNGIGNEFTQYNHPGSAFGAEADKFIAAGGHFGRKSRDLVKGYAEALGLDYMAVTGKTDSEAALAKFFSPDASEKPMLAEVFTDSNDESEALKIIKNVNDDGKVNIKRMAKNLIGQNNIQIARRLLRI